MSKPHISPKDAAFARLFNGLMIRNRLFRSWDLHRQNKAEDLRVTVEQLPEIEEKEMTELAKSQNKTYDQLLKDLEDDDKNPAYPLERSLIYGELSVLFAGSLTTDQLNAIGPVFGVERENQESDSAFSRRFKDKIISELPPAFHVLGERFMREFGVSSFIALTLVGLLLSVEAKRRTGSYGTVLSILKESHPGLDVLTPRQFYAALSACLLAVVASVGATVAVIRFFRKIQHRIHALKKSEEIEKMYNRRAKQVANIYRKNTWKESKYEAPQVHKVQEVNFTRLLNALATGSMRTARTLLAGFLGGLRPSPM